MCSSEGDTEESDVEDEDEMKMVLVVRTDLKMGKGKVSTIQPPTVYVNAMKQLRWVDCGDDC